MALKLADPASRPTPLKPPLRISEITVIPKEVRSFQAMEFRIESGEDGKKYFTGHAAPFNSRSEILADKHGRFQEIIRPGAFSRAISERQDVRHLINHDPSLLLGRTGTQGTTELFEDEIGLGFKTLMGSRTYERDLEQSLERGDISGCSFAFTVHGKDGQRWSQDPQNKAMELRELLDLDIGDVSIVTYPTYSQTSAAVSLRTLFPDCIPEEISSHLETCAAAALARPVEKRNELCECTCESCVAGNCDNCTNTECEDVNCDANWDDKAHNVARRNRAIAGLRIVKSRTGNLHEAIQADRAMLANSGVVPAFRAASEKDADTLELLLYGDIGESWYGDGITAKWIKAQVDQAGPYSKLKLRINSFGGDAFEGVCIGNFVRSLGKPVETCIDGLAASAASVVAMCGDVISMAPNAMLMIHNASTMAWGYASDLRKVADVLEKISQSIAQTYVARTGNSAEEIQAMLDGETWMSAQDCMDKGFATEITTPGEEDSARSATLLDLARRSHVLQVYRNVPELLRAAPSNVAEIDVERERLQLRARAASMVQ